MAITKVPNDLITGQDTGLQTDIALLAFKTQANGSLAKYNLADQIVDSFEDASGVDASASTGESRDSTKYYSGVSYGSYSVDAITSTGAGTWTCPANTTVAEILIVAGGGGGGGRYYAGGGGAGGVVHDDDYAVVAGTVYDVTVGVGGTAGAQDANGGDGADSVWNVNAEGSGITLTASGGGGGAFNGNNPNATPVGGSGGGAAGGSGTALVGGLSDQADFPGATSYGNAGGASPTGNNGGGGGGAGAVGSNESGAGGGSNGGPGGVGKYFANFDAYGTDSSNTAGATPGSGSGKGYFGGGGGGAGGGHTSPTQATGGAGGGGKGSRYDPGNTPNTVGYANTGGGGGASSHHGAYSGAEVGKAGGTGIILLRHRSESYNDMTLISTSNTASSVPSSGDIVLTYTDGAGTATINTDIKAWVSRDNGTTYTQGTLASQGTSGGHNIATANSIDISGQPSGTSMRWKVTTHNQSTSKATRIQAVSLGWA
ncbi:MAG: hypothetical protein GY918_06365 [Gammaproteobacteria bacterium]|nr:hypothetical protein [Gammaproteobacteria bacterium]